MKTILVTTASFALLFTAGCATNRPTASTAPKLPSPVKVIIPKPVVTDGSIYQLASGPAASMIGDVTARSKGDIVTILVIETLTANRSSDTATSKTQGGDAGVTQLMGLVTPAGALITNASTAARTAAITAATAAGTPAVAATPFSPGTAAVAGRTLLPKASPFPLNADSTKIGFASSRKFAGSGSIKESGTVTATLAAQVVDVLDNGNLVVMATKEVTVSGDTQIVTLTGIVRLYDVDQNNQVLSSNLAEARINISGSGPLNDAQRRTLVSKALDWVNLF